VLFCQPVKLDVALVAPTLILLISCAASTPTGGTNAVTAVVFYDENGNGALDSTEVVRLPQAQVTLGNQSGTTDAMGHVTLEGVASGTQSFFVHVETLPPFYEVGSSVSVQVPQETSQATNLPVSLPIGSNIPNTYMAFGDSITIGDGSTSGNGYRGPLQDRLLAYFDACLMLCSPSPSGATPCCKSAITVIDQGIEATRTNKGAARIDANLTQVTPAYTLIHYGTNDWNEHACQVAFPCYTIDNLRLIVRSVKAHNSLPFLATIIPVNVGFDERVPPQRQTWVAMMDDLIRPLAAQEGAVLVDLQAAFLAAAPSGDLRPLFSDHVHPSDLGYAVMTAEFFKAITVRATPASPAPASLALLLPPTPR
jgi:lysophospholipase L1-like esterase